MMRFAYVVIAYLLAPVMVTVMLWRGLRDRSYLRDLSQRFGYGAPLGSVPSIWVHAVSVGEVQASAVLVRELRQRFPQRPLLLTTVTPTGADRARSLFGNDVTVRYIPYDLPGAVRRFFTAANPCVAVILETELWPNLYHECGRRGVPLVLASARISPRSVGRYRKLAALFRETLSHGIVIAAQSEQDAERFRSIGANPARTHVTGNIKFDLSLASDVLARGQALRQAYAQGRQVWVAGSTHEGEESAMLAAQRALQQRDVDALLVLVPRHPNRFDEVANGLQAAGVKFVRRSKHGSAAPGTQVLLVDTLGELVDFYAAADVAFVAGSLVPIGGHNLLEPVALGLPTLTGPYNFNAEDIAAQLLDDGATQCVRTSAELAEALATLLGDAALRQERGSRGRAVIERNRGALTRLLALLQPVIEAR
jgi:3-deoxy-D-manno-octulosonic-acid transferase